MTKQDMRVLEKYNIPFWDYQTSGFYLDNPEYWHDELHMSGEGAAVFSSKISHDLKNLLSDKNDNGIHAFLQ